MGWTKQHRESTRQKILSSASALFRRRGYESASIDDIMAGAGLTRGGFYQHFQSKQDLFAAYVGQELDLGRQLRRAGGRTPDDPLRGAGEAVDFYLTPGNRPRVARGCTIVSNAADLARAPAKTRRAFTRAFRVLCDELRGLVRDRESERERERRALAAIATCTGGVVLARALADETLVEALLGACRESVARELGEDRG